MALVAAGAVSLTRAAVSLRDYYSFASGVSWRATRLVERCDLKPIPVPRSRSGVPYGFEILPRDGSLHTSVSLAGKPVVLRYQVELGGRVVRVADTVALSRPAGQAYHPFRWSDCREQSRM